MHWPAGTAIIAAMDPGLPFLLLWGAVAIAGVCCWLRGGGHPRWQAVGLALGCLSLGGFAGEGMAAWRDLALRDELLQRSRHLASGLDREDLAAHRNLAEDVGQPWFERIKARLQEARNRDGELKYAYLLEQTGLGLQFPNDDDDEKAPDFEPPSIVYADAPDEMRTAIAAGAEFAIGPYPDRWGEFITVGTPIALGGNRRMFLALDVLAANWRGEMWLWRGWPTLLGLALAGMSLLFWSRGRALRATRAAQRAAEEANRAKDSYLATVSHDLRSPLGGIIGMTGLLADTELTAQQREFVQLAHNSSQQLLALVNELLDYARIETGRLDFDREPVHLREVVEDAVALHAPNATAKGVDLNAIVDRGLPASLVGDADRIRQILHNLISNAVKFTDEGEVQVRVRADPGDGGRVRITVTVSDTGHGIDTETFGRLFQPFEQGADAQRRKGGTGLGLCIAQRIARALGGDVTVVSTRGKGSTFTASFQLEPDPQPQELETIMPLRRGARVLVGVGPPAQRDSLCEALASLGLEPVPAADRAAVAAAAAGEPPAAAIISAAWSRELTPGLEAAVIPVAVLSERGAGGTQLLASRHVPVLMRPVRREALMRLLHALWGRGISSRQLPVQPLPVPSEAALPRQGTEPDEYAPSEGQGSPPKPARAPSPPRVAMPVHAMAGNLLGGLRSGIDVMREAASRGDLGTVRRAAQGLRSAAEPLRLTELSEACAKLEVAAGDGKEAVVLDLALNLDDLRRRTQQQIAEMSRQTTAGGPSVSGGA